MSGANPHRGETLLHAGGRDFVLRPSFAALVAAEEEIGPLLALVERASAGQIRLAEIVALFWHCLKDPAGTDRDAFGAAVTEAGLAACTVPLRALIMQILKGSG